MRDENLSIMERISKATATNVVTVVIIVGAVVHSVWREDTELLKYLAAFAIGHLFGAN
jgi:hypothetical protein